MLDEHRLGLGAAATGHDDNKGHAGLRLRHHRFDGSVIQKLIVDLFFGGGAKGHAMEALLAPEIFTFDCHLLAGFGFIWLNLGDGGALRAVADRIFLDFDCVRSLDGFGVEQGKSRTLPPSLLLEHGRCGRSRTENTG